MSKKIAFIFPGQGSQFVGMLADLAKRYPLIKDTFEVASNILADDLWHIAQQGPKALLDRTDYTQPILLTSSVAIWRVWEMQHGLLPCWLAGHSLGEYSALVCAESLSFADALQLVVKRGRYMQQAVPTGEGAMAAIVGLDEQQLLILCQQAAQGQVLSLANYNAADQVVLAGETAAIERVITLAKQAGAKLSKYLPVSVPSHCALMQSAAQRLQADLQAVVCTAPKIPVVNNVDVQTEDEPDKIKDALIRQLYSPVHWVKSVQFMVRQGVELFIECGPGRVLAGLNRRLTVPTLSISKVTHLTNALLS